MEANSHCATILGPGRALAPRLALCGLLLAVAAGPACAGRAGPAGVQPAAGPAVRVARDRARFVLPAPARDVWEWNRAGFRPGQTEYEWSVTWTWPTPAGGWEAYKISAHRYHRASDTPKRGALPALVADLESGLWHSTRRTAPVAYPEPEAQVTVSAGPRGHVVLELRGAEAVARAFAGRPPRAVARTWFPPAVAREDTVAVEYAGW